MNISPSIIKILNLSKRFEQVAALDNVSFDIPHNSIFGILGSNGSGKSTLMRILAKLIMQWSGKIYFNDSEIKDSNNYLNYFGFIIESPCFYEYLSARKNLEIFCRLTATDPSRIDELFDMVDLLGRADEKVSHYSYGMKQRLGIAQALLHDPQVLVLDEPNNGLDPVGITQISDILFQLKEMGKTICISTHSLIEVDRLCTDVAILKKGKLLISDSIQELNKNLRFYRIEAKNIDKAIVELKYYGRIKIFFKQNNTILLSQHLKEKPLDLTINTLKGSSIKSIHKESRLIEFFYV